MRSERKAVIAGLKKVDRDVGTLTVAPPLMGIRDPGNTQPGEVRLSIFISQTRKLPGAYAAFAPRTQLPFTPKSMLLTSLPHFTSHLFLSIVQ